MNFRKRILRLFAILFFIAAYISNPVAAELEEVVVTAQKHAQGVNDVGITVNAFSGEMIKEWGITSTEDIASFTPGLTVTEGSGTGVPVYTIRGVGFQDSITSSNSSTVGLYFDEVALPYALMASFGIFDVERVEVLKGPQGDLYGRNTTGGQINFISNKPTEEFDAGITIGAGNFKTFDVEGYASGSLGDSVNARLAFTTTQSGEGWQRSLTRPGDTLGERDTTAIRALFDIDVSDNLTALVRVHYAQDNSDNLSHTSLDGREIIDIDGNPLGEFSAPYASIAPFVLPTGAFFGQTPPWYSTGDNRAADWDRVWTSPINGETVDLTPRRDNQLAGISAKLEWDLGGMTLTSITAYDDYQRNDAADIDGTASPVQNTLNESNIEVFSQELRLTGQSEKLLWIAGLYYSQDDTDEFYNFFMQDAIFGDGSAAFGLPAPFTTFPIYRLHTLYDQESDSQAVFGHVEYNFTDKWRITAGLRYTNETRDWSGCTFDGGDGGLSGLWNGLFGATLAPGACGTLDSTPGSPGNIANVIGTPNINDAFQVFNTGLDTSRWMGKLGIDYSVNDDLLLYAMYSSGFKSGGFNGNNSNTTTQLDPYEPEELLSLEIGVKATLLDGRMQLNAAAFQYDYKDKQVSERAITPVGAIGGLGNVDESEVTGFEMDIQFAPTDGLQINFGAAWLDTEITDWITPVSGDFSFATGEPENVVFVDASGAQLPNSPELSYSALANYQWAVGSDLIMDVGADVNFTDEQVNPASAQQTLPEFTLVNARVGVGSSDGKWRAMLWSRNLTDEYYWVGGTGGANGGFARRNGTPRTYGLSLDYKF